MAASHTHKQYNTSIRLSIRLSVCRLLSFLPLQRYYYTNNQRRRPYLPDTSPNHNLYDMNQLWMLLPIVVKLYHLFFFVNPMALNGIGNSLILV